MARLIASGGIGPRLGAHTYLFTQYGVDQAAQLEEIFDTVAAAGFPAIELPRQAITRPPDGSPAPDFVERAATAARKTGLGIVGVSHGQPLWNTARRGEIMEQMTQHAARMAELATAAPEAIGPTGGLQCGVSCSGKKYVERSAEENDQVIALWHEIGTLFREKGLVLAYHTHGEPIADIQFVADNVPAEVLAFGPDLDWLRVGGVDPEEFLRTYAARVTMMHLRDYHSGSTRAEDRTAAIGEGDVDYRRLRRVLEEIGFAGEVVVELAWPPGAERDRTAAEILAQSREHLRRTMGL